MKTFVQIQFKAFICKIPGDESHHILQLTFFQKIKISVHDCVHIYVCTEKTL